MKAFLRGLGSILNICPTLPEPKLGTIEDDWKAIGQDFAKAMDSAPMPPVVPPAEAVTLGTKVGLSEFFEIMFRMGVVDEDEEQDELRLATMAAGGTP